MLYDFRKTDLDNFIDLLNSAVPLNITAVDIKTPSINYLGSYKQQGTVTFSATDASQILLADNVSTTVRTKRWLAHSAFQQAGIDTLRLSKVGKDVTVEEQLEEIKTRYGILIEGYSSISRINYADYDAISLNYGAYNSTALYDHGQIKVLHIDDKREFVSSKYTAENINDTGPNRYDGFVKIDVTPTL